MDNSDATSAPGALRYLARFNKLATLAAGLTLTGKGQSLIMPDQPSSLGVDCQDKRLPMELTAWLSLIAVCLLGAMSPGPSLAVVLNSTLSGGPASGYLASLAHGVGVALYALLTVAGLAVLVTSVPALYLGLQILGAFYLIYLGVNALRSAKQSGDAPPPPSDERHNAISRGFLVAFLNPKLAVFMLALFSQFLDPTAALPVKALMVATVGVTDAAWYCLVVMLVSREAFLTRLRDNAHVIDRCFGIILILLAITVIARSLSGA